MRLVSPCFRWASHRPLQGCGAPADIARRYRSVNSMELTWSGTPAWRLISRDAGARASVTAGRDFCLVHNGSLSNRHLAASTWNLRHRIRTDNDTERPAASSMAAARAMISNSRERGFSQLDGFYTF